MTTPQFAMCDTRRPDGCYVEFRRQVLDDDTYDPTGHLFQDPDYREQDQERLDAFRRGYWSGIGVRARAFITIVENGTGFSFTVESPGLWGIESDSGEAYLDEVYHAEVDSLTSWLRRLRMDEAKVRLAAD